MINAAAKHHLVVDVGANGRQRSNSYDLLRFCRWKGILIEANPSLIPGIEQDFAGLDVQLINCAISDVAGDGTLYIGINSDVSSLIESNAASWGKPRGTVSVKIRLLSEILQSYHVPTNFDLLSIDIEGLDIIVFNEILQNGYRPQWVIIEASNGFKTKSLSDLPFSETAMENYGIAAQTGANLILCHGLKQGNVEIL
jgi:FkbM family methyltransferase